MCSICNRQWATGKALHIANCSLPIDPKGQSAKVNETFPENLIKAAIFPLKKR
jgi:hypothetical protein